MYTKYDFISVLAIDVSQQISQSESEWAKYLTCAGKLHK